MSALPSISTTIKELGLSSQCGEVDANGQQRRSNNVAGIQIVGSRIYDSTSGITCHQCRQKTQEFAASCKNLRNGKPCVMKFCHKCLLNRYGEKAQEVELLYDWICPKCRGICNCSLCMKKRGHQPTGPLAHTAKASRFKSVSEMLDAKASENMESNMVNNEVTLDKELAVYLSGEPGHENSLGGNGGVKLDFHNVQKITPDNSTKTKQVGWKEISNGNSVNDDCQNKSLKRCKICTEVPEEETKGDHNCAVNDIFSEPVTLAPKNYFINTYRYYLNQGTQQKIWNGSVAVEGGNNAGAMSQTGIEKSQCVVHSEREIVEEEIPLPPFTELTEMLDIEFPPDDVENPLQLPVFGEG